MKVAGKAKQIDLMRNSDCRERANFFHVIEIGCAFNQIEKKNTILLSSQELNGIALSKRETKRKQIEHSTS